MKWAIPGCTLRGLVHVMGISHSHFPMQISWTEEEIEEPMISMFYKSKSWCLFRFHVEYIGI